MTSANTHITAMGPYTIAELSVPDGVSPISLAQNESAFPPSPDAISAATSALARAHLYPDPNWTELRSAIAHVHEIDPVSILCGMGSMELISALMVCFAGPDRHVLSTDHAYAFFRLSAQMVNAPFITAPEPNQTVSVDALLASVTDKTCMVCVANPGNPTGTRLTTAEIRKLRDALDPDILLVVDEAYGEFSDDLDDGTFDLPSSGNTVVLRTFSKAYGLAGLRIGWGVFPEAIAAEMRKVINPSNISVPAQAAAVAAMQDQDYMRQVCDDTIALRDTFAQQLRDIGVSPYPSFTNFILIPFADVEAVQSADQALRQAGVVLRGVANYGLPHCLRATIGQPEDMSRTIDVLRQWAQEYTLS